MEEAAAFKSMKNLNAGVSKPNFPNNSGNRTEMIRYRNQNKSPFGYFLFCCDKRSKSIYSHIGFLRLNKVWYKN